MISYRSLLLSTIILNDIYIHIYIYIYRPIARGSVGSKEPPSQRKVHYLVMKGPLFKNKVHLLKQKVQTTIMTTPYRDIGIGLAGSVAARLQFHPQLKIVMIS